MAFNVHSAINREGTLWRMLWAWPKIDLHRHLEGSLRLSTLSEIARAFDIPLPARGTDGLRAHVQITDADDASSTTFLSKFEVLRRFYCSLDVIARVTREAVEDAAGDHIKYLELRFTPHALARHNDFAYDDVIAQVCQAAARAAADFAIQVRLIVSVNRHESVGTARRVLDATLSVGDPAIVALDLAGQEVGHPARPFADVFARARRAGLGVTVHAGEWDGPASVREAVEALGAERIGHGVRAVEDPRAVQLVRERGVTLEVCPTSNLQSGVVARPDQHPLIALSHLGVLTTINTDDPSISAITLTDELALAHAGLGLPLDVLRRNILNASRAAFLPPDERVALVAAFERALESGTEP